MKKSTLLMTVILIAVIPILYLSVVYRSLPPVVPTHFGLDGKPNDYSSKTTLIWIVALLSVLTVGVFLLLTNIQRIDPKRAASQSKETMQKMAFAIVFLVTAVNVIIIYAAGNSGFSFGKLLLPLLGLFFAWLGNLMNSIKPNYFVGIRTPWTLEDEDTWRKTHQLAGKLWFAGGILIAIIALLTPEKVALILMISVTAVIAIVPAAYSYRYFQRHRKPI